MHSSQIGCEGSRRFSFCEGAPARLEAKSSDPVAMHRRGKGVLSIRNIDRYVHFGLTCDGGMLLYELYFISIWRCAGTELLERIVLKVTVEYVKVCVHDVVTYACLFMCSFLREICASVLVSASLYVCVCVLLRMCVCDCICACVCLCVVQVVFTATKVNRLTPLPYLFICIRNLL